jgi:hypothetical protein
MYTCPKCQAVYFIDITGQPEFGDMSLPIPNEPLFENHFQTSELIEVDSHESLESMNNDLGIDQNPFEMQSLEIENVSDFSTAALEITDFANQDNEVSAISYDLKVTCLDTKETMLLFREAVDDVKFGWIAQEIFSTIKNGQCEFKNLNPIQAFILAQRIQFLDVEMEWKQNVQN